MPFSHKTYNQNELTVTKQWKKELGVTAKESDRRIKDDNILEKSNTIVDKKPRVKTKRGTGLGGDADSLPMGSVDDTSSFVSTT